MVDKNKNQQFNYGHEALPVLFHSQYNDFINYLGRDRTAFLEFWWKHVGDQLDKSLCKAPKGLNFQVRDYEGDKHIILITLPQPETQGDTYFVAGIKLPEKRIPFVKFPSTRVIVLDKSIDEDGKECTWMSYVTPQLRIVPIGYGPQPDSERFINEVRKIMKI
ncbi:MAG: hypothetical protein JW704_00240 [Anaerolineaceae bacterium]|nr:hypothetical protein [Anaerolineaceae bacterium]MBN2677931.1 hypothetical protein [Anaerolineaceae bacterium]